MIEKVSAFIATLAAGFWLIKSGSKSLSDAAATGFLFGIFGSFLIMAAGVSAGNEALLLTALTIVIGFKYGWSGLGMSLVGYLMFGVFLAVMLVVGNKIRRAKTLF
jgi:hypothetical protein